jgi:hypothetical protein
VLSFHVSFTSIPHPVAERGQHCDPGKGGAASEISESRSGRRHGLVDGMTFMCMSATGAGEAEVMYGFGDTTQSIM